MEDDCKLQHQFQHADWSVFASKAILNSPTNINLYADTGLEYTSHCTDGILSQKQIKIFYNWSLLDKWWTVSYSSRCFLPVCRYSCLQWSQGRPQKGYQENLKMHLEEHFSNSDWRMRQDASPIPHLAMPLSLTNSFIQLLWHHEPNLHSSLPFQEISFSLTASNICAPLSMVNA